MKYTLSLLIAVLILAACNQEATWPQDLAGKKQLVASKKQAIKALETDLAKLKSEIAELDTTQRVISRKLVTTKTIEKSDFERFIEIQGAVESGDAVKASSETGGRIVRLNVKEGQNIRKGQIIASLDMESVNKQISELETSLKLAEDVYTRQKRLWDQNIGSEMQFLQAKNNKERLEKSMETVRHQLTKANVYAPISGVIDQIFSESGEVVGPGTPIVQILNMAKVKVVANVPEKYLSVVKKGSPVTIEFPALNEKREAKVTLLGRTINPANRTFSVEVELTNKNNTLKPNLLSLMSINDYNQKEAIILPLDLIQQEISGKNYVFITQDGEDGLQAKKVYIETGESYEGQIIITKGLEGGESLITNGAKGLAENELLKISERNEGGEGIGKVDN